MATIAEALSRDPEGAALEPADRAMIDFAIALTRRPDARDPAAIDRLRAHGFDDPAIHRIVHIVGFFNYYNRLVDGLGVEAEPEW